MQLVLSESRDDFGVGDDVHDGLRLRLKFSQRCNDGLLACSELCRTAKSKNARQRPRSLASSTPPLHSPNLSECTSKPFLAPKESSPSDKKQQLTLWHLRILTRALHLALQS